MAKPAALAVSKPAIAPRRSIVRAAITKAAPKVQQTAKNTGRVLAKATKAGGTFVLAQGRRGGRAVARVAKENWKTILLHEGIGTASHGATFGIDKKARETYLKDFDGSPVLKWLLTPSNLKTAIELGLVVFMKGNVRKVFREMLRGTFHAKLGHTLHTTFPDAPALPGPTQTRGVGNDVDEAGSIDEEEPDEAGSIDEEEPDEAGSIDEEEPDETAPRAG